MSLEKPQQGDLFYLGSNRDGPYILCQTGCNRFQLVNIMDGNRWKDTVLTRSELTRESLHVHVGYGIQIVYAPLICSTKLQNVYALIFGNWCVCSA